MEKEDKEKNSHLLLKKLFGLNGIKLENGTYSIWGIPMFFFSYKTFAYMQHEFESKDKGLFRDLIYSVGYLQAKNGTNILIKKFGIGMKNDLIKMFLDQAHMLGIGDMHFTEVDEKNTTYWMDNTNNPVADAHAKLFGKQEHVDHYLRGIIAGALSALYEEDSLVTIERNCISKGDKKCLFETKKMSKISKKDKEAKGQIIARSDLIANLLKKEDLGDLLRK